MDLELQKLLQQNFDPYFDLFSHIHPFNNEFKNTYSIFHEDYFCEILMMIKSFKVKYKLGQFQQRKTLSEKLQFIKAIYQALQSYWSQKNSNKIFQNDINLIELVTDSDKQIYLYSKLVVETLFKSEQRQMFVEKMLQTNQKTQQYFMKLFEELIIAQKISKCYSKNIKSEFDKILLLQSQNQQLLVLVDSLIQQRDNLLKKQLNFNVQLDEKNKQIQRLQIKFSKFKQQEIIDLKQQIIDYYEKRQIYQEINNKMQQKVQNEQILIEEIQGLNYQIIQLKKKLQKFNLVQQYTQILKFKNQNFKNQNEKLHIDLEKFQKELVQKSQKVKQLEKNNISHSTKIINLENQLFQAKKQLEIKSEQLQNIKFEQTMKQILLDQFQQTMLGEQNQIKSSIGSELLILKEQQAIASKRQLGEKIINKFKSEILKLKSTINSLKESLQNKDKQIQKLKIHEIENKKLVDIISHMNNYRGEENEILMKCLYKMRVKMLKNQLKINKQKETQRIPIVQYQHHSFSGIKSIPFKFRMEKKSTSMRPLQQNSMNF